MASLLIRWVLALLALALVANGEADDSCPAEGCGAAATFTVPRVIIGCWQLLERHRSEDRAVETLLTYARAGFTAFDTADIYGPSEKILGRFRRRWEEERAASPEAQSQEPVRFFTKYVTDDPGASNANSINANSLRSLGVTAPDLVQFHWWSLAPDGSEKTFLMAARELKRLHTNGKVKYLAGCNMDTTNLDLLVQDGMEVVANQVQYSLLDRRAETKLLPYVRSRNIKLLVFGVVGGGLLSDRFLGLSEQSAKSQLDSVSRRMYWSSLQRWTADWSVFQELLKVLHTVGQRKEPSLPIAAIASHWVLQRLDTLGAGGALILGVRDAQHVDEHHTLLKSGSPLDQVDMADIQAVLDKGSAPQGDIWYQERGWL